MSENINFDNVDVSTFGLSPPGANNMPELLRFSRKLDEANAQRNVEYYKAKEVISASIHNQTSNDEFVETIAEVVTDRIEGRLNNVMAPLVTAINDMSRRLTQVEHSVSQLSARVDVLGVRVDELREDFRASEIERKIHAAQNANNMLRCSLGKPAKPVCFYTGEDPVELGLPPLRTASDVDDLSLDEIDRYCAGYRLPGLIWNNGATTGCKTQKEAIRNFLRLVNVVDLEQKMRNNRTD